MYVTLNLIGWLFCKGSSIYDVYKKIDFLCGCPHGAASSPSTGVHLSLTPLPPCGRHKWIAPNNKRTYKTIQQNLSAPYKIQKCMLKLWTH